MQRLFSAFPSGGPGAGLFLLRGVVGVLAAGQAVILLMNGAAWTAGAWALALAAILCGLLLVIGLVTPGAAAALAAGAAACLVWGPDAAAGLFLDRTSGLLLAADAVVLVLLGPGAFSLDARLFGRREILIPPESFHPRT